MKPETPPTSWSIAQALAVSFLAFTQRFGADLLWQAFKALTTEPERTMAAHLALEPDIDVYLPHALQARGAGLVIWMANARADLQQAPLLLHCAVRWWRARDDLLGRPAQSRVLCVYAEGDSDHVSLQLLNQMLYRGAAPYTTCD